MKMRRLVVTWMLLVGVAAAAGCSDDDGTTLTTASAAGGYTGATATGGLAGASPATGGSQATGGSTSGGTGGYPWYYGGIPTIWIKAVVRNTSVTFRTHNFPAGLNFDVLMGPMGSAGIGGYYVGSFNSGAGGQFTKTFNVPPQLVNHGRIAIRTQNLATGYYSYNWFYNNTTP